ncbi:MAG TPA: hypothetical protein VN633_08090, partial [Bryobacteraceae bacterium]|nr:hypothetical protein [Bryobacteraceae bacterium]
MRFQIVLLLVILSAQAALAKRKEAHSNDQASLTAYFVDVEGGQATLLISPEGHSILIDAGWAGHDSRDADRIANAAKL